MFERSVSLLLVFDFAMVLFGFEHHRRDLLDFKAKREARIAKRERTDIFGTLQGARIDYL
jgi:hypothetical protein